MLTTIYFFKYWMYLKKDAVDFLARCFFVST